MPVLHLVAGPHGAGKSTYVARVLRSATHLPFAVARAEQQSFLTERRSFIADTTFNDGPRGAIVDEASVRGYFVHLHVVMVPVELAAGRVADRFGRGGHDVAEQAITDSYDRLWLHATHARRRADFTEILDNSHATEPFRRVATYAHGLPASTPEWPSWAPSALTDA